MFCFIFSGVYFEKNAISISAKSDKTTEKSETKETPEKEKITDGEKKE